MIEGLFANVVNSETEQNLRNVNAYIVEGDSEYCLEGYHVKSFSLQSSYWNKYMFGVSGELFLVSWKCLEVSCI